MLFKKSFSEVFEPAKLNCNLLVHFFLLYIHIFVHHSTYNIKYTKAFLLMPSRLCHASAYASFSITYGIYEAHLTQYCKNRIITAWTRALLHTQTLSWTLFDMWYGLLLISLPIWILVMHHKWKRRLCGAAVNMRPVVVYARCGICANEYVCKRDLHYPVAAKSPAVFSTIKTNNIFIQI